MNQHLAHRDVRLVAVSRAPLAKILDFNQRMGWQFDWASSFGNEFNRDFGVSFSKQEAEAGEIAYNYGTAPSHGSEEQPASACSARTTGAWSSTPTPPTPAGSITCSGIYNFLDLTLKGRDEDGLRCRWSGCGTMIGTIRTHGRDRETESYCWRRVTWKRPASPAGTDGLERCYGLPPPPAADVAPRPCPGRRPAIEHHERSTYVTRGSLDRSLSAAGM